MIATDQTLHSVPKKYIFSSYAFPILIEHSLDALASQGVTLSENQFSRVSVEASRESVVFHVFVAHLVYSGVPLC